MRAGIFIDKNDETGQYRIGVTNGFNDTVFFHSDNLKEANSMATALHAKAEQKLKEIRREA
jgi:hypothetical protein